MKKASKSARFGGCVFAQNPLYNTLLFCGLFLVNYSNASVENVMQIIRYSLRRVYGCYHQIIGVDLREVDVTSIITYQLCNEHSLHSAVAFSEWMYVVDRAIEIHQFIYEFIKVGIEEIVQLF